MIPKRIVHSARTRRLPHQLLRDAHAAHCPRLRSVLTNKSTRTRGLPIESAVNAPNQLPATFQNRERQRPAAYISQTPKHLKHTPLTFLTPDLSPYLTAKLTRVNKGLQK